MQHSNRLGRFTKENRTVHINRQVGVTLVLKMGAILILALFPSVDFLPQKRNDMIITTKKTKFKSNPTESVLL